MKTKSLLLFLTLIFGLTLAAENVPLEKAQKVATNFYFEKYNRYEGAIDFKNLQISNIFSEKQDNETYYYVVSFTNGGFVIVPADDCLAPVIGYSFKHNYVTHNQPPNVKWWLKQYADQVIYARENKLVPNMEVSEKWTHYSTNDINILSYPTKDREIEPLLTTLWDQGWPYNISCPKGVGGQALTGCVATAYAQMLYYWRFPWRGSGFHCYEHPVYGELCADFENTYYRWDEMCDDPKTSNTAIGELMYQMGVALDMNYGPTSSGAMGYPEQVEPYFNISLDYDSLRHDFYTNTEWRNILLEQLDFNYPVGYIGFTPDSSTGHMWVCDGYQDTSYFHMNWGWGGSSNGYYTLDNLQGFNENQFLGINFYPDTVSFEYPSYASGADTCFRFEGSITDGSGPVKNYLNNTFASWLIDPQNEMDSVTSITLNVVRSQLGEGDYLRIYDGMNNSATILAEITGDNIPDPIVSLGNQLYVEFTSNEQNTGPGFYINYSSKIPIFCSGQDLVTDSIFRFDDGSGKFYYNNSRTCMWYLQPEGCDSTLTLYFDYFDTEAENDYLRIIDPQSQEVLAQYSGYYDEPPTPVSSPSGSMLLLFATNSSVRSHGWSAFYGQFLGIEDNTALENIVIYPNPTNDQINLQFTIQQSEKAYVELFSIIGQKVMEFDLGIQSPGNQKHTLNINDIQKGTYYLKFNIANETITRKIIKL